LQRARETAFDNITRLNIHKVLFGIGFFHPSGFGAKIVPQYVYQSGDFLVTESQPGKPPVVTFVPKGDHFWVFDAAVSYRLPKRAGILTIEARNLCDREFKFQGIDPSNPTIYPKRLMLAKFTLAF